MKKTERKGYLRTRGSSRLNTEGITRWIMSSKIWLYTPCKSLSAEVWCTLYPLQRKGWHQMCQVLHRPVRQLLVCVASKYRTILGSSQPNASLLRYPQSRLMGKNRNKKQKVGKRWKTKRIQEKLKWYIMVAAYFPCVKCCVWFERHISFIIIMLLRQILNNKK